jgi:hypothetical protein
MASFPCRPKLALNEAGTRPPASTELCRALFNSDTLRPQQKQQCLFEFCNKNSTFLKREGKGRGEEERKETKGKGKKETTVLRNDGILQLCLGVWKQDQLQVFG